MLFPPVIDEGAQRTLVFETLILFWLYPFHSTDVSVGTKSVWLE